MADEETTNPDAEIVEGEESTVVNQAETEEPDVEPAADGDELVVTLEGEPPAPEESEKAPEWVKELRKKSREDQKLIRQQQAELNELRQANKPKLPAKPKLEDFEFDSERFEAELEQWFEKKRELDQAEASAKAEQEQAQKAWQERLESYNAAKAGLKVSDFDDAEETVRSILSEAQQSIIIDATDKPELVVLLLGRNPEKAKELSKIQSLARFAAMIGKLEKDVKVTQRKPQAQPERAVAPKAPAAGMTDSTLEKLRAEADRTGDRTKVAKYLRERGQ